METVHILHTNDIHAHINNWPRTARFLNKQKEKWNQLEQTTAYNLELGDAVDRVHPLAEATNGKGIISLLNEANYDAATIGNNEGVGQPKEDLNVLYDDANFPVTIANLYDEINNQIPQWAEETLIFETKAGTRIGLFGLTYPFEKSYRPLGWDVRQPFPIIQQILQEFEGKVDCIILMSHLGIYFDRQIAERFSDIDIIIGAHTHHVLPKGEKINGSLLTGGGRYNDYVGHITIEIDDKKIVRKNAELILTEQIKSVPGEADIASSYISKGKRKLDDFKVANLPQKLETDWHGTSTLSDFAMDAISEATETNQVFLNAGLLVESLDKGILTKDDLHSALPHSMRLAKLTLPGKEMEKVFLKFEKNRDELQDYELVGTGFRGEVFGDLLYKDIDVDLASFSVYFSGEKLLPNVHYTFATVDFFAFSPLFPDLSNKAEVDLLFPKLFRDIIGQYAMKKFPIEKEE